jgi:predicted amidohydrolase
MTTNAFVAYYPFDTLDVTAKLSHDEKVAEFTERLKQAAANIGGAAAAMKLTGYIGFFAVPEYYFLKSQKTEGRTVTTQLYTQQERDALLGTLISLSDQFNKIVILPGTVNWRRPLGAPRTVTRQGKTVTIRYEGISSVPVCYSGDLIHTYNKVMNDAVIDATVAETAFAPGTESPLFEVRGLKCGLEICGDFNEKNLSKATGPQTLDFEFMMSASNYHMFGRGAIDGIPVKNGGYFLHVDQKPSRAAFYNGVWCVSRGSGWHSVDPEGFADTVIDPWTLKTVKRDQYGVDRSVGHVVALDNVSNFKPTSGISLPGRKSFAGLKLSGLATVTKPLDPNTGAYEVTLKVTIQRDTGSQSDIDDRTIHFKADGATVRPASAQTNAQGEATAVFGCRKAQPARLHATFHNAKVTIGAKIAWLGPGEVTKLACLKGLRHGEVPTFFTPFA